jgi:hypothetical protein
MKIISQFTVISEWNWNGVNSYEPLFYLGKWPDSSSVSSVVLIHLITCSILLLLKYKWLYSHFVFELAWQFKNLWWRHAACRPFILRLTGRGERFLFISNSSSSNWAQVGAPASSWLPLWTQIFHWPKNKCQLRQSLSVHQSNTEKFRLHSISLNLKRINGFKWIGLHLAASENKLTAIWAFEHYGAIRIVAGRERHFPGARWMLSEVFRAHFNRTSNLAVYSFKLKLIRWKTVNSNL